MSTLRNACLNQQRGAALVVSLVLLAVITLLGVVSMQTSNAELKMAGTLRDRAAAFEAAEAALVMVERTLAANPPLLQDVRTGCTGATCFNPNCTNGLCFNGDYAPTATPEYCEVVDYASATSRIEFWSNKPMKVWTDSTRHKTMAIDELDQDVKYIVEFLCYQPTDGLFPLSKDNASPLYRITVLAEGNGDRATVSLQSTYKVVPL